MTEICWRGDGSCEWNCTRDVTLSLPFLRLQFHDDAAARQAAGDDGLGRAALAVMSR
jgi:hypothetical protein